MMFDLAPLPLAETVSTTSQLPPPEYLEATGIVSGGILTFALIKYGYQAARRGIMGYLLPDGPVDVSKAEVTRDPVYRNVAAVLYGTTIALTTAGVYDLTASLGWSLLWAGTLAFVAAVVALSAARNATPLDDIRVLAVANRGEEE